MLLYNSAGVFILINYFSILYGVHVGEEISERLMAGQAYIYMLYMFLYCMYIRIQNLGIYADICMRRRSYMYGLIQLYSCYSAFTDKYVLMSLTGMLAQTVIWKEHIQILGLVNEALVKND